MFLGYNLPIQKTDFSNVMQVIWAINLCILYKYRKIQIYFEENVEKKKKETFRSTKEFYQLKET